MKKSSLKINYLYNLLYQVLILATSFFTVPYVSRVLGVDNIGINSFTTSVQTYFSMFAALGTLTYGQREIARARDDVRLRSKLFWEIEMLTILTTSVCIVVWVVLICFSGEYKLYYTILTINIIATMLDISWFFTGMELYKVTVGITAIYRIVGIFFTFIFVNSKEDLAIYIMILALTALVSNVSMWFLLKKYIIKFRFRDLEIKRHFKETLVYFIPTIATSVYTILDKTLIGIITKSEYQNGCYEQATKIVSIEKTITFSSLNTVMTTRTSYLFAEKIFDEIKDKISKLLEFILFFTIAFTAGIFIVADDFVTIFFGPGYEPVADILLVLNPIIIFVGITSCLGNSYYTPSGNRGKSAKYVCITACVNLFLNLLFIPRLQALGACISSIIAEMVMVYLYVKNCENYLSFKKIIKVSSKKVIAAICMISVLLLIKTLHIDIIIKLCIQVIVGGLLYIGVLFILNDDAIIQVLNEIKNRYKK